MENNIELGSEFNLSLDNLQKVKNNLFLYLDNYNVEWVDYGRSAIRHVPFSKEKKVLLPEFICESVRECFSKNKICFYKIDNAFQINLEDILKKIDNSVGTIYIAHYFGYLQNKDVLEKIKNIAEKYGIIIIEDTTQSLFSNPILKGDYGVASIRKWMPIPMGGILYSAKDKNIPNLCGVVQNNDNSRAYGMVLKDLYLKTSFDANSEYRHIFEVCESRVDLLNGVKKISDLTKFLIECIDIEKLINKRKNNMQFLQKGLLDIGITPIRYFDDRECPFAYPIRVKNRDQFRKYMIDHRIYCAVHWPFDGVYENDRLNAKYNAETLISLPIDQRYGEKEISYMLEIIRKYGGELSF